MTNVGCATALCKRHRAGRHRAAPGRPILKSAEQIICSFSVWRRVRDFEHFIHNTVHGHVLRRRDAWFVPGRSEMVLWNVPIGHVPDIVEALDRLEQLRRDGASDSVFTLASWKAAQPG